MTAENVTESPTAAVFEVGWVVIAAPATTVNGADWLVTDPILFVILAEYAPASDGWTLLMVKKELSKTNGVPVPPPATLPLVIGFPSFNHCTVVTLSPCVKKTEKEPEEPPTKAIRGAG